MKAVLHNEAIKNVTNKIDTKALDYIVIDQFAERNVYKRYALSDLPFPNQTKFETKGEFKNRINVSINDQNFTIIGDDDPEHIRYVAHLVDEQLRLLGRKSAGLDTTRKATYL